MPVINPNTSNCNLCEDEATIQMHIETNFFKIETSYKFGPFNSDMYYCDSCFNKILLQWSKEDGS